MRGGGGGEGELGTISSELVLWVSTAAYTKSSIELVEAEQRSSIWQRVVSGGQKAIISKEEILKEKREEGGV